jgi:hypothetical protein
VAVAQLLLEDNTDPLVHGVDKSIPIYLLSKGGLLVLELARMLQDHAWHSALWVDHGVEFKLFVLV